MERDRQEESKDQRSRCTSLRSLSAARDEAKAKNLMGSTNKSMRSNEELLNEIEKIVNRKRGFTESRSEADVGSGESPNKLKESQYKQK